jgi:hypothetical protein
MFETWNIHFFVYNLFYFFMHKGRFESLYRMLYQTDICSLLIRAARPRSEAPWWEAVNQLPVWSNYVCSFVINAFICIQLFFRSHDYRQKAIALSLFVCDLYAKALDEEGSERSTMVRRAKCRRPHSVEKINYNKQNFDGLLFIYIHPKPVS